MTLGHAALYLIPLAVVALVIACYVGFVYGEVVRLARHEYWCDRFFSAASILVDNSDIPDDLISLIEDMNHLINRPTVPVFIYDTYSKKIRGTRKVTASGIDDEKFEAFVTKHPTMIKYVDEVLKTGLLAMTYAGWVCGVQARAVLADVFALGSRTIEWNGIQEAEENAKRRSSSLIPLMAWRSYAAANSH